MDSDPKTHLLILDDEPIVCKRLKSAFEKLGYHIECFTESARAMSRIQEKDFDIVITDLKMKQIDGMQFLTAIKEKSPDTEVIVITGFAFQKGVFDFVAKPFKIGEIQEIVKKAEKKRADRLKGGQ
jgi:DNA-binding NtrC family response regulator